MNIIPMFTGALRFCSNFFPCYVVWVDGRTYAYTETIYQIEKTIIPEQKALFRPIMEASAARSLGRDRTKITAQDDWDNLKFDVMRRIIRAKFDQHPELRNRLLATGDLVLVETNYWHDNDFGDCLCGQSACRKKGRNMLGVILMEERAYWRSLF